MPIDTIVPVPDAQKLVNISAPRGKSAAQCERQLFQTAISMIVAENSVMKKVLKLITMLGIAVLMIPLSANAQEHGQGQGKGAPAARPAPAARAAPPQRQAAPQVQAAPQRQAMPQRLAMPQRQAAPQYQAAPQRQAVPQRQAPQRAAAPARQATPRIVNNPPANTRTATSPAARNAAPTTAVSAAPTREPRAGRPAPL